MNIDAPDVGAALAANNANDAKRFVLSKNHQPVMNNDSLSRDLGVIRDEMVSSHPNGVVMRQDRATINYRIG